MGSTGSGSSASASTSNHANDDIIKKQFDENVFEIEAAKIAEKNAESKPVKDFAKQIQKDHGDAKDALSKLAKNRNIKLDEDQAKKEHQAHLDQMKNTKGAAMDRHFAQMMSSEHAKDLSDLDSAMSKVRDSGDHELAQVLESEKAAMERHQRTAQNLEQGHGQRMGRRGSSASDTSSTAPSSTSGSSGGTTGSSYGGSSTGSGSTGTETGTEQGSSGSSTTK